MTKMNIMRNPTQEDWFDEWAKELIAAGYIDKVLTQDIKGWEIYEGESIEYHIDKILYAGTSRERIKKQKKKYVLHRPVSYTPDRVIFWTYKAKDIFFTDLDEILHEPETYFLAQKIPAGYITVLDVKSPFSSKNSSDVSFSIKKKWVWVKERVYVNQAVMHPIKQLRTLKKYLWPMTFTPTRYLWTDGMTKLRTIPNKKGVLHWEVRSLQEFIDLKTKKP